MSSSLSPAKIAAPKLCPTFEHQSKKIWKKLASAYHGGISRKEETITEDLLLELLESHPSEVITWPFNSHEEAEFGADWEWWLTNGQEWLGLLIQAKKLDPDALKYKQIKHVVAGSNVPQIDLLIGLAQAKGIDPLYIFYNYSPTPIGNLHWNCGQHPIHVPFFGCTVAHAIAVRHTLGQGGAGLPKMSKISFPLRCLVCCPEFAPRDSSLPRRAAGLTDALLTRIDVDGLRAPLLDRKRLRYEPPDYVKELLEAPPDRRRSVMESLRRKVGPVGKLVVIRST